MGFKVDITGGSEIKLDQKSVIDVEFLAAVPQDSNARTASLGVTVVIKGKILTLFDGSEGALNISEWSRVDAKEADCYRTVKVQVVAAGQIVREYTLDKAFVVDYTETFDDTEGVGTFELVARQKKDNTDTVQVNGGFGA